MFYQIKKGNLENVPINTEKYSKIILEIEKFIEAKRKKPTTFKGTVDKIDFSNNILTVNLQSTNQLNLSNGSLILIREDDPLSINIRAITRDFYNSNLKLEIKTNPSQFKNKKVVLDTERRNVILERLNKIVDNIKKGEITLDNVRILDFIIGENKPYYNQKKVSFVSKRLNKDQECGVMNSIKAEDFHLIIGPPGTGKTYVIEELIRQFIKRNQKLLVTAWTNLAVDNIIKRLSKKETKNLVRIGPINEVDSEVKKFSIFEKMKKHEDWVEVERYRKIIDELFKLIPKRKEEINSVQESISSSRDKKKIFDMEINTFVTEKQKYEEIISRPIENKSTVNISSINNEIALINKKSETCLSLSRGILDIYRLQLKIPGAERIKNLKRLIKR